jgi:uncharacterized protein (DUF58 family)
MTSRLGPGVLPLLGLIGSALFLGFLTGRPEPMLVAAPLCLPIFWALRPGASPDFTVTHAVSATRLFEGDRVEVTVTLSARSWIPAIELLEPLPPTTRLVAGSNRAVFALGPGEEIRWRYTLACAGRGRFSLGTLYVRVWENFGLRVREALHRDPKPVSVYPRAVPLRRLPQPRRTQTSVGNYVSPAVGQGLEPADIRPFAPGDRVRHVNWRASLRLGKLFVTQYHQERNADVVLMLDTLSQVGISPASSLDLSVQAAASLAASYLARKDRVGLIEYGGVVRWVRPGSGRIQLERLLDALLAVEVFFSYVTHDLALVPPRVLPPQALVIGLSPLVDPRFMKALGDLVARGFDVVLLSPSPVEVTRAALGRSPMDELACRLWALEREAQLADLRRRGLRVLDWRPDQPLELAIGGAGRPWRRRGVAA